MALFPCWSRITDYFCGSFFDKNRPLNMLGKFTQTKIHKLRSHSVCLFTISHRAAGMNLPPSLSPVGQSWPPDSHVEQPIVFALEGRTRWLWGFDICVGTFLCFTRFEISAATNSFVMRKEFVWKVCTDKKPFLGETIKMIEVLCNTYLEYFDQKDVVSLWHACWL